MLNFEDFLLIQMKNRMKILAYRTVIWISFHNICHEIPPFAVYLSICTLTPFFFIFYFYIAKQCECFLIQKNGMIFSAIFMYHIFHFRSEQIMTSLVFLFLSFIQFHCKCFDHIRTSCIFHHTENLPLAASLAYFGIKFRTAVVAVQQSCFQGLFKL